VSYCGGEVGHEGADAGVEEGKVKVLADGVKGEAGVCVVSTISFKDIEISIYRSSAGVGDSCRAACISAIKGGRIIAAGSFESR
jgi:hypothetical protein